MPLTREEKEQLVQEYVELLRNSRAMIVTDYRGLSVTAITKLRREIADADGQFMVVKNRLFRLAMKEVGMEIPDDIMTGPVAAGFCYGDVPPVAKALTEFAKESEILVVRGGLMDENFMTLDEVKAIADLPPLEVVRAQLLGVLGGPASNVAGIFASGVRQVVNVLSAYSSEGDTSEAA